MSYFILYKRVDNRVFPSCHFLQEPTIKAPVLLQKLFTFILYEKKSKVIADEMLIDLMDCFVNSLCRCIDYSTLHIKSRVS